MESIKLSEAKAHLGRYARLAAKGRKITITDRNKAVAILSAVEPGNQGIRPKTGLMEGKAKIASDFDEPLEDFEKAYYGQ